MQPVCTLGSGEDVYQLDHAGDHGVAEAVGRGGEGIGDGRIGVGAIVGALVDSQAVIVHFGASQNLWQVLAVHYVLHLC